MVERSILCVSPDEQYHREVSAHLRAAGIDAVIECETVGAAREQLETGGIDCVITAFDLPDGQAPDLFEHVRECSPDTGCLLYTATEVNKLRAASSAYLGQYIDRRRSTAGQRLIQLVEGATTHHSHRAYPLPPFEQERLKSLRRLDLDSPTLEPALKRLVDLASIHYEIPQATINIVADHRLEFLACSGEDWEAIPRESSMCTYNILTEGVTVVEDTFADPRFTENGLLREFDIRFYAGAPIRTEDGLPIGTLCLHDGTPRQFSETDERFLELLAAEIADWLTLDRDDRPDERTLTH